MTDWVYENGIEVLIDSAMGLTKSGTFYDAVSGGLALYGAFMNAKASAQMNDLNYQSAQLALVEKYKTGQPSTTVTAPGAAAPKASTLSPVVLLVLGVGVLFLLKRL